MILFVILTCFELKEISERAWSSSHPRLSSLLLLTKLERQLLNQRRHLSSEACANFTTWGPVQLFTSTLCPEFALESLIRFKKKKKRSQTWETHARICIPEVLIIRTGNERLSRIWNSGLQDLRSLCCGSISFPLALGCWPRSTFSPKSWRSLVDYRCFLIINHE